MSVQRRFAPTRRTLAAIAGACAVLLGMAGPASAQPTFVVRPAASYEALADEVAQELRRAGLDARTGEAAPELLEAVPAHHVGVGPGDAPATLRLTMGLAGGHTHAETLNIALPQRRRERREVARTLALAIQSLADEEAPERSVAPAPTNSYTYLDYAPNRPERQLASPTLYFGLNIGYSPARNSAIFGPGAGFGLCVKAHCVVLEAQLSLLAEERQSRSGTLRYRFVNVGLRGQFRPLVRGRFSFGPTVGVVIRNGNVQLSGTDVRDIATSLAFRGTLEFAVRLAGPFEWVVEAGADVAVSRAMWLRSNETVFLEDRATPFVVTALRLRPDLSRSSSPQTAESSEPERN